MGKFEHFFPDGPDFLQCSATFTTVSLLIQYATIMMTSTTPSASAQTPPAPNKHVILIGIDGCRPDALEKAMAEIEQDGQLTHFIDFFNSGAYDLNTFSGGYLNTEREQPTISGPSWTTVLTGVYSNQHNIRSNDDIVNGKLNASIPTVFNYVYHNVYSPYTAAIFDFKSLENMIRANKNGAGPDDVFVEETIDVATSFQFAEKDTMFARHILRHRDPQLMFLYYVAVDAVGHLDGGFGPENPKYMDAIKKVAEHINDVLSSVDDKRKEGKDYLVIMLTDHGGEGTEPGHGDQSPINRRTWMAFHNPTVPRFSNRGQVETGRGLDGITPTILRYLMGAEKYDGGARFPLLSDPIDPTAVPVTTTTTITNSAKADENENMMAEEGEEEEEANKAAEKEEEELKTHNDDDDAGVYDQYGNYQDNGQTASSASSTATNLLLSLAFPFASTILSSSSFLLLKL